MTRLRRSDCGAESRARPRLIDVAACDCDGAFTRAPYGGSVLVIVWCQLILAMCVIVRFVLARVLVVVHVVA